MEVSLGPDLFSIRSCNAHLSAGAQNGKHLFVIIQHPRSVELGQGIGPEEQSGDQPPEAGGGGEPVVLLYLRWR